MGRGNWVAYVLCLACLLGAIGASVASWGRVSRAVKLTAEHAGRGAAGPALQQQRDAYLDEAARWSWAAIALGAVGTGLWIYGMRRSSDDRARSRIVRGLFKVPIVLLIVLILMFFLMV